MSNTTRRAARPAGQVTGIATLLLGALLVAACGSGAPQASQVAPAPAGVRPLLQAPATVIVPIAGTAAPGPEVPNPHGNSAGSFGIDSPTLPAGPAPTTVAAPTAKPPAAKPPANPPAANPPAHPPVARPPTANPAAPKPPAITSVGSIQNRHIPPDRLQLHGRLVYAGPNDALWTADRDGHDARIVLSKPADQDPPGALSDLNLSPDGQRLLYTVGGDTPAPHAYLLDMGGATLSRQPYNGAWAYDSRHIVTSVNGQIVVADVTTGATETLGEGSNANWTADNQIIAVRNGNLWLIPYPAKSGTARQLSNFPTTGDKVWGFSNLLQYHYTGHILFAGATRDTVGAQGNGLGLWSFDVATHRLTQLALPGGNYVRAFALSPDGTQLAWAQQAHSSACSSPGQVGINQATGASKMISIDLPQADNDFVAIDGLTWTRDTAGNLSLAFGGQEYSCQDSKLNSLGTEKVYTVTPGTSTKAQVLFEGAFPVWVQPWALGMTGPAAVASR